jgi:hypothetical protein
VPPQKAAYHYPILNLLQVDTDMKVQADEFDGKVVYGQKKAAAGSG